MKKKLFLIAGGLMFSAMVHGQVGVNTQAPKATLDIVGTAVANVADGVLVPRYTVAELAAKDAAYGASQNGALVFVVSGTGSTGKTSDITGTGFYYYDNPTSKWKAAGGSSSSVSFNVTTEQVSDYTVLATDSFIKLNITTAGHILTLPTSGVPMGKTIYVSNIGNNGIDISPLPRNPQFTQIQAGSSGALVYLGGTGDGSWDWVTGF
ncbi:hypothetical protein D1631_18400 [Chryseobacterium nematophagum]|uniref:T9SS C-terminal target domain-containing protein n=1 Tax=Chryseobacterium nematophagum TaxID=2305228 RepID=A0A3M7TB45_9FLAO|nr:hypothetical protein [Chryseobacterium nematophagum]RNA60465.1 hypothetical protein D1631_18400 [Chryseobacterium nematophagum]